MMDVLSSAKGINVGILPVKESMMYCLAFCSLGGSFLFKPLNSIVVLLSAVVSLCIFIFSVFRAFAQIMFLVCA